MLVVYAERKKLIYYTVFLFVIKQNAISCCYNNYSVGHQN